MSRHWPKVPLSDVVSFAVRSETPVAGRTYRQVGVRLWGEGAYERESMDGIETKYSKLFRAESGDIIVNKIWARNGSVAVVPDALSGCYGSSEFPMFAPQRDHVEPRWIHWLTKTRNFWEQCDEKSRGTSGKNRIRPDQFLEIEIPLPPLAEQRRIVARIEELSAQINEVRSLRQQQKQEMQQMLLAAFSRVTENARRLPMRDIAPLIRRPVQVDALASYPELGIRSFGKGTFHKPALTGIELGSKRVFRIEPMDLLFSNVFAWEGAIAVANGEDVGRIGSHRYMTCVPNPGIATPHFLCFYFLTNEGLEAIRAASPGGAGRNRTLGLEALAEIAVPIPELSKQRWFDSLLAEVKSLNRLQVDTAAELDALLPAILDRAFRGEL